jgi:hypothetical protein
MKGFQTSRDACSPQNRTFYALLPFYKIHAPFPDCSLERDEFFFISKIAGYFCPSYKKNIQHFKN